MLKRRKKAVNQGIWMITYSDMVTLLLCFFVLMYASSTLDINKWQLLVKSLNPNAAAASMPEEEVPENAEEELPAAVEVSTFDQLYERMSDYVEENNMSEDVEVRGGDGYTFIIFKNNILFDGDRYNLKSGGGKIIDFLCSGIAPISEYIGEMRILGHTNQADPNKPNEARGDRFLSSNRATEVLVYIQEKNIIDPKKLVSIGYGQFYPVAPFVMEDDRQENRRVEILITESNAVDISLESVYSEMGRDNSALQ